MKVQRKMRQSQTLSPFGVGGILDLQGESLVACDIYRWKSARGDVVRSPRLTAALRVANLYAAPAVESNTWAPPSQGLPYARFPTWLFCSKCRNMVQWKRSMEREDQKPECPTCPGHRALAPMRWIQICPRGHMGDVDWFWWAHQGASGLDQRQCKNRGGLQFLAASRSGGGGLNTLSVRCRSCRAQKSLAGLTSAGTSGRVGFRCEGRQPWQFHGEAVVCDEEIKVTQRGASNVYFPSLVSSIEIPDASGSVVDEELALAIENDPFFPAALQAASGFLLDHMVEQLASNHDTDEALVRALIAAQSGDGDGAGEGPGDAGLPGQVDLQAQEWLAFLAPNNDPDHPDFVTRQVDLREADSEGPTYDRLDERVSRVIVADRLREVRALVGFNRVTTAQATMVPVDLGRNLNWLPAIDVRGEGLFLAFDEKRLVEWENDERVAARAAEMSERVERSFQRERLERLVGARVQPRYLMLHTLAHLLIRRLAFETGYSASSLRERIYGRTPTAEEVAWPQAGLLIYTAAGDSEGTLGGLVRQGEPPHLARTLIEAVNDGGWCSSDPLCVESEATSFDSLNLAACHACSLTSETSCEASNFLLDRVMVVGNGQVPGFLEPVWEASVSTAAGAAE